MARIYIARSTGIGSFERHVVLKMILPERAQDETSVQMFLDEARLAASLNHQNVAQVFEVGKEAGIHFLAMEYVHGQDLRALLAKAGSSGTRVPLELALTIVAGAASGLEHAHERRTADGTPMGIVHRDVSPSNIMVGYDGAVKLLDFGIAKAAARSVETQSGIIKGKFAYMAPEQCRGRDVDRRSDVFSLGIILYEVTTQHRCFRADNDFDTMHRIVTGDVVRPTRLVQGYPQALEAIVMKALAVDAVQRYQSAGLLLEAIESFATAARMSLSTMSLGRFMRDMFGDIAEPWLTTGGFNRVPPPSEQTISSTNASGAHPRAHPPSSPAIQRPPLSASSPAIARPSASSPAIAMPGLSSPGAPRPSSLSPALPLPPGAQRSSSSSLSSPALHRPSSPLSPSAPPLVLPPQHDEAPMHLPPDLPLEAAAPVPDWSGPGYAQGYPQGHLAQVAATPAPELQPPQPPQSSGPVSAPLGAPYPFSEASRSESAPAHPALYHPTPPGTQPIVRTRQGYANAPAMSRSEVSPRFEPHELEGNVSLQPSNRLLYIGLGVVLVGIIVLLAISISDNREDAPSRPSQAQGGQGAPAGGDPDQAAAGSGAALRPEAVKPEAFRADATATGGSDPAQTRRATIHLHVVSTPPGAEVSLSGKPLGITPLDVDTDRRSGTEVLTIHRARYQDVTAAVDLGRDFAQSVALQAIREPGTATASGGGAAAGAGSSPGAGASGSSQSAQGSPASQGSVGTDHDGRSPGRASGSEHDRPTTRPTAIEHDRPHPGGHDGRHTAPTSSPAKDDCQPPDKINPYEAACHGHVCKPCPTP